MQMVWEPAVGRKVAWVRRHPVLASTAAAFAVIALVCIVGFVTIVAPGPRSTMPNLLGTQLNQALSTFDDPTTVEINDAFGHRSIWNNRVWTVVDQQPAPGTTVRSNVTIVLWVGRTGEADTTDYLRTRLMVTVPSPGPSMSSVPTVNPT